jgi:hypothetical protein
VFVRYDSGALVWDGKSYRHDIPEEVRSQVQWSDYSDEDRVWPEERSDELIREMLLMVIPEDELDNPTWQLPAAFGPEDDEEDS